MVTFGILKELRHRGIECPGEMSIVGYSDIPTADLVTPPLTTVAVDHYHMGAEAAKILLSVVDADSPTVPRSVRFPVSLVTSPEQAGQGSPVPSGPAGTSG